MDSSPHSPHSPDTVQYALESTRVLYEPDRRIETFASTRFDFVLLSEPMDRVGMVRIRSGEVEASQPQIIRPKDFQEISTEGFGAHAKELFRWMEEKGKLPPVLQYGFNFKRGEVAQELLHEPIAEVRSRVVAQAKFEGRPMQAIIEGVDDAWEICLLRFAMEMIAMSQGINLFDFKRKGLL